jgi:hypothetical protein
MNHKFHKFSPALFQLALIWLAWYALLMTFQQLNWARLRAERPDPGYAWTAGLTGGTLDGPSSGPWFYARWDSYRYVGIAQEGYSDPIWATFFPGYPLMMRALDRGVLAWVMEEDERNSRMTLAGLLVSGMMSWVAVWGLHTLLRERLALEGGDWEGGALRGAFYLLAFPTALFMVQVYTESAYLALSVWALVWAYRRAWWLAGALAVLAALTRPTGIFLCLPLFTLLLDGWWRGQNAPRWAWGVPFAPLLTFWLFNQYLAANGVDTIAAQRDFGRYLLHPYALWAFAQQIAWMLSEPAGAVQIGLDLGLTLFATWLCLIEWKHHPGLALYGLAVTWVSLATGQLVSQNRYVLAAFPIYFVLARWGRAPAFDRGWLLVSLFLLVLYHIQFTQGLWTG